MIVLPLVNPSEIGFVRRIGLFRVSKSNKLGSVKFTENNICVSFKKNVIHYYLNDINKLTIHGNLFKEFYPTYLEPGLNPDKVLHSGLTKFILQFDTKSIEINVIINSKKEFDKLIHVIKQWYKSKKYKIKEYDHTNTPMLLLNPYYSYETLQEIKKELDIKSIYG